MKINSRTTVQSIEMSADEWELYTSRPGAQKAAEAINSAIMEGFNQGLSCTELYRKVSAVMRKYADLGAMDSEPIYHLDRVLRKLYPNENW